MRNWHIKTNKQKQQQLNPEYRSYKWWKQNLNPESLLPECVLILATGHNAS